VISVGWQDDESAALVEYLYRDLADPGPTESCADFHLAREPLSDSFALRRGEAVLYRGPRRGQAALLLLEDSLYQLAAGGHAGLLFHAACVARHQRAVVFPGSSGAGKTTLAAWLTAHRFDYLTDELVCLPEGTARVDGFRRPLHVKTCGRTALADVLDFTDSPQVLRTDAGSLVAPAVLSDARPLTSAQIALLIFPHYQVGAAFDLARLSAGRTALHLMATLVNARSLPGDGLAQVAELARAVPAYALTYGSFDGIVDRLGDLLEHPAAAP
jgi:hypothetical protein